MRETKLTTEHRAELVAFFKQACTILGCGGMDPQMCKHNPHLCEIVQKACKVGRFAPKPGE